MFWKILQWMLKLKQKWSLKWTWQDFISRKLFNGKMQRMGKTLGKTVYEGEKAEKAFFSEQKF